MLSSTGNNRPRNARNIDNVDGFERDELGHENTVDDKVRGYVGSYDASSSYVRDGRFRPRGRVTEFRHSRGRGISRGRANYTDSYKFHEPLVHSEGWSVGKSSNVFVNLPEDPRISKLLRRLCAESDVEKSLVICSKLQDAVMLPENSKYIRRSYETLVESLLDVLYGVQGPETKEGAALVLGRIGFVMGPDFGKHLEWLISNMSTNNNSIKHLMTLSLVETFQLDSENPTMSVHASAVMDRLRVIIEGTTSSDVFIAAVNTMITLSNTYAEYFAGHFVDTVDILVGWHVDNSQPKIKEFTLQSLFKLSRHWQADIEFSITLLNHFIEDILVYSNNNDVDSNDPATTFEDNMQKVTSFINVFNTVVQSLGVLLCPTWPFISDSLTKILQVMTKALKNSTNTDLLLAGNESISLLLGLLKAKTSSCAPQLYTLITIQLTGYLNIQDKVTLSIIQLIAKTIKDISSNLPIEFIVEIIGVNSLLRPLRYSKNTHILQAVISIYSNLLNLKNIPLLQETYKYVLSDVQSAFVNVVPDVEIISTDYNEEVKPHEAEKNVIFYLQCLSELANASNSIIGMWALKPSILELLAVKMCPYNKVLVKEYPALHYAIMYLLYSHCKKNNHFIASSDLVSNTQKSDMFRLTNLALGEVSGSSPTSGHLSVILDLLSVTLERDICNETMVLMLNWISDILVQMEQYFPIISMYNGFTVLITNMLALGCTFEQDIAILVLKNSLLLLRNKNLMWNSMLLKNIASLCLLHFDNKNKLIRNTCLDVIVHIPWDVMQLELDGQLISMFLSRKVTFNLVSADAKIKSFKEYLVKGSMNPLPCQHFKSIANYLLQAHYEDKSTLQNVFLTSWPSQSTADMDDRNTLFFRHCAITFSSVLVGWLLSELAHSCVLQKLRTPLGKPQETFMKIEGALKGMARDISAHDTKYVATEQHGLWKVVETEQIRSRWLTEFMVFLEKYIYNAAEGTAVVLPSASKPVRTFFHTNWSTCREWFSRVRPASLAVSLHAGHHGAAIYHAQLILQTAANSNTNMDVEAVMMSAARAIIKLQEPEVLHGFYVWVKQSFNKKFHWLKAAADQSNSRYETAADYYKKVKLMHTSEEGKTEDGKAVENGKIIKFLDDQVFECYKHIKSWEQLQTWLDNEQQDKCTPQWNAYASLHTFDQDHVLEDQLSNWELLDFKTNEINKNSCSYQGMINNIESTLIGTAIKMYHSEHIDTYDEILSDCESVVNCKMVEFTRSNTVHIMKELAVLKLANQGLRDMVKNNRRVDSPFKPTSVKDHKFGTNLENLCRILWWNEYFTKVNTTDENIYYVEHLRLDVVKAARKTFNLSMAKSELFTHFRTNANFQMYFGNAACIEEICDVLRVSTNSYDLDIWSLNNARSLVELCKLTYGLDEVKIKAINLCASVSLGFSQRLAMGEQSYEFREKGTRMLLTLSKWVQNENESILINNLESPLTKLITALPEIGLVDNNISENVIPLSDSAVGKLLQFSVNQCPGLAKAWSNFAAWCFRWGRKMVEFSSNTGEQLTETDKMQIKSVMIGCSPQDYNSVCEILSKTKATYDDEEIDWSEINTSEMIENQLRTVPSLSNAYPDHLALLVDIWKQAQKRVFSYFELSADAYFKFLQLICAADYINHSGEYSVVSATLRLLRLIVKHAMELQTVLESGLANTPTQPWKVIIPQLFSRLNHPETYVRKCVSDLLCRLAEDTPHLITFPAVVGAVENEANDIIEFNAARTFLSNDAESVGQELDLDDTGSDKVINNELNSCFLDMVETLTKQAPKTIQQVKLLVKELQRINLLWDELWLGSLVQHHSDFNKRLSQLELEITKVKNNSNLTAEDKEYLIKEKHRIIVEPIVYVLEQLNRITSANPETPHEIAFQTKFQDIIDEVIDKLKNPINPAKPQESWAPLKQLQLKFHQKVNRRTSYVLKMSDISPVLADLKDTVITMPGVHTNQRTVRVTIKSVENTVSILPTKTRPKKLVFFGSDGRSYIYLFKGLEDLHLDERIMQLLSIVNTMMARDTENDANQTYRARHYSVIPLGPRSGLISWVDNVTPLFVLYKKWQNREAATLSAKTNKTVNVLRPSELFYNKLNPLLQEAGISTENRKEWPVSILKQVLEELASETPKDLLWRELWCGSVSPEQWWRTIRRYSYSMAVMSTIGYIIGLGDRHLDNVLVDLTSGEVVHIDYNVCFEKGKTLRVPEKVPFRMTPNLVTALGVTGVEGIFRLACEHVLRAMRRGRETLLTLLEAFVYDPLVEWGSPGSGRRRRSQRDVRADLAMLAVRSQELKQEVTDNIEQFMQTLPEIKKKADKWLQESESLNSIEMKLQNCHQQMALVKEIEAFGPNLVNHPLYSMSQKYSSYKQAKNAMEDSEKALLKLLKEYDVQIESHAKSTEILNGPQLLAWVQEYSAPNDDEEQPIFEHITEFLTNAGQAAMIAQCVQVETELKQCLKQTRMLIKSCLELLSHNVAVTQYYPQSRTQYHRTLLFRKWIATALESQSPEVCREVSKQISALTNNDNNNANTLQLIGKYNYRLQTLNSEAGVNLKKAYERLQVEGGPEAMAAAHESYREAKANLSNWLRTEEGALEALENVVMGKLCALNKSFITLESRAQSAGDCLVDLTSREGEWFLDEMCALSMQAVELLSLLPLQATSAEDAALPVAVECVRSANMMLADLVQLNYNFSTIILPETLKKVHSEDAPTLVMINELNQIILKTPIALNELLSQLEIHLRFLVMDMDSPAGGAQVITAELRARYEALLLSDEETQSSGRMLLLGFNGLFAAVESRWRELFDHLSSPVSPVWRKIDQINESTRMCGIVCSQGARAVVEDMMFVRRLQAIVEVFAIAANAATNFTMPSMNTSIAEQNPTKPIRRVTAELVSRCLLGVHSRAVASTVCMMIHRSGLDLRLEVEQKEIGASWSVPLELLCEKAQSLHTKGPVAGAALAASAVERGRQVLERLASIQRALDVAATDEHVARLRLAAHTQLHHEALGGASGGESAKLSRRSRELSSAANKLVSAHARAQTLVAAAHQRLKWGAGANPELLSVLSSLERGWGIVSGIATAYSALTNTLTAHTHTLHAHGAPAAALKHFRQACALAMKFSLNVSPVEESLMEMLHPEGNIDSHWVNNVSALVKDMISQLSVEGAALTKLTTLCANETRSIVHTLGDTYSAGNVITLGGSAGGRTPLSTLHYLLSEVKSSLTRLQSYNEGNNPAATFLESEKRIRNLIRTMTACLHPEEVSQCAQALITEIPLLLQQMLQIHITWAAETGTRKLIRQSAITMNKNIRPSRSSQGAVMWKRVRLKLEGRERETRATPHEQVDYIISEAMNMDNLCLMYEGWMAWV